MFSYGKARSDIKNLKRKGEEAVFVRMVFIALERIRKKISACLLSLYRNGRQASMTVEAAFVLPLFLFAVMNILSIVELYRLQGNTSASLHNRAKVLAVAGVDLDGDECVDLLEYHQAKPFYGLVGYRSFTLCNRARTRAWTGYDNAGEAADGSEEQLVYITPDGEVYHTTKNCTYLKLSIRAVDRTSLDELRNKSGGIYYACDKCGGSEKDTVYITDYGERWHSTLNCSGLKRTINLVPISQAQGRRPCSKCGD